MNSFPDDEMCDLETLEALLNEDDESPPLPEELDGGMKSQVKKTGISKEMEDFMNAVSDDESDVDNVETKKSLGDLDSKRNTNSQKESSDSPNSKESSSSTMDLMQEMLKMKERMEELQEMLSSQQSQDKETSKARSAVKKEKASLTPTSTAKTTTMQKKDSSTSSSSTSKIRLMRDEDEGNLFFNNNDGVKSVEEIPPLKRSSSGLHKPEREVKKKPSLSRPTHEDSDSDWEDMDGDNISSLSEEGKNLKKLLKLGEKRREAHKPKFDSPSSSNTNSYKNRKLNTPEVKAENSSANGKNMNYDKRSLQCSSSSNDQIKSTTQKTEESAEKVVVEDFSKIRIINPLISSSVMKTRMEDRKLIHVSRIQLKLNTPDLQGDWVTIGVVVSKTDAKASSSGKPYSIWRLSDLQDLDHCASFFLFGQVHKNHWKLDVGAVVGLLNPSMMESTEKGKSEPAFTLKNPNQLMVLGLSKDLGWCKGHTKKGNKCSNFLNKKQGDFCAYHVQAQYKKTSAQRLEFHGSVTGVKPKSFEQRIFAKNAAYTYGGKMFLPNSGSSKSKNALTLSKLQERASSVSKRVNTFSIHDIKPSPDIASQKQGRITEDKIDLFADMISIPSPGSMNLVAHIKKTEMSPSPSSSSSSGSKPGRSMESISATDLLKQHKQALRMRQQAKPKASDLLLSGGLSKSPRSDRKMSDRLCDPLRETPVLGKGFSDGQDINLLTIRGSNSLSLADRSKLKAIQALRGKGGISKEDPNAVKKSKGEKEMLSIKKRLHEEQDSSGSDEAATRPKSSSSSSSHEPQKKKSKFLGNVDLNSAEVKAILKAKSKHSGALAEKEAEREDAFFEGLEKKEMLEEKLKSVTSIEITVFTCKQCHYTAQSALDQCKKDQHTLVKSKTKKRFFACKKCKHRTDTINGMFPTSPCQKCGSLCFEKTSMYKEKSGPKLDSEVLCLRGDEMKFINSMDNKVYMNTVVD